MVAYHEAGHTIVAVNLPDCDPVHKVTIIPRGRAGGATFTLPEDDRDEVPAEWVLDSVTMAMGGRVAERLVLNRLGSGAQSDIVQATKLVRRMVTRWGMSEELGPVAYGDSEEHVFLGKDFSHRRDFSEATAQRIDEEVTRIIKDCYKRAERILEENMDQLHLLARTLLERETLDAEELRKLLNGEELPPLESSDSGAGNAGQPSAAPGTRDDPTAPATGSGSATEESTAPEAHGAADVPPAAASSKEERKPTQAQRRKPDPGDVYGTQH
jgi:cell division protease FtsH